MLAILTRPNAIVLAIVFCVYFWLVNRKKILYFLSGIILILFLLAMRNIAADADSLLKFSQKGPQEFASGNILESNGVGWTEHPKSKKYFQEYPTLIAMMVAILKNEFLTEPLKFIKLQFNKICAVFNNYEIPNNYNFYYYKQNVIPLLNKLPINFAIIFSLASVGIFYAILLLRRKDNEAFKPTEKDSKIDSVKFFVLLASILLYSLSIAAFYVISRFRFPILPMFAVFAGFGVWAFYQTIITRKFLDFLILLFFCSIAFVFSEFFPVKGFLKNFDNALAFANDGAAYKELNNLEKAAEKYKLSMKQYPALQGYLTLINILAQQNKIDEQLKYTDEALKYYPDNSELLIIKAALLLTLKKDDKMVIELLNKSDDRYLNHQQQSYKYYNLAVKSAEQKEYKQSLEFWRKYCSLNPSDTFSAQNIPLLENWLKKKNNN